MNDPEVTMTHALPANHPLDAVNLAMEAATIALALARAVPAPLRPIADQLIRAISSVPANLAEGHGRTGRDRIHHWRIAYASAKEADIHLRLLLGARAVDPERATTALALLDRSRGATWRLLHTPAR